VDRDGQVWTGWGTFPFAICGVIALDDVSPALLVSPRQCNSSGGGL
jgi:hypothetical protein